MNSLFIINYDILLLKFSLQILKTNENIKSKWLVNKKLMLGAN